MCFRVRTFRKEGDCTVVRRRSLSNGSSKHEAYAGKMSTSLAVEHLLLPNDPCKE